MYSAGPRKLYIQSSLISAENFCQQYTYTAQLEKKLNSCNQEHGFVAKLAVSGLGLLFAGCYKPLLDITAKLGAPCNLHCRSSVGNRMTQGHPF